MECVVAYGMYCTPDAEWFTVETASLTAALLDRGFEAVSFFCPPRAHEWEPRLVHDSDDVGEVRFTIDCVARFV